MMRVSILLLLAPALVSGITKRQSGFLTQQAQWEWNFPKSDRKVEKRFIDWYHEHGWKSQTTQKQLSDTSAWPQLRASTKGFSTGLANPQVFVVSMQKHTGRREFLKSEFEKLALNVKSAEWAPAVDGAAMSKELKWLNGFEDKAAWDADKPGNWGCYLSHLQVLLESHARCAECDVVLLEDDITFAPDFHERWNNYFKSLPEDWAVAYLGSNALWNPPLNISTHHIQGKAVSNTWGYVVRAKHVKQLASLLAELPVKGLWGIDAVYQLFTSKLKMYLPPVPMVLGVGQCHDTDPAYAKMINAGAHCDTASAMLQSSEDLKKDWPAGYYLTYCQEKGALNVGMSKTAQSQLLGEAICKDPSAESCCPYRAPPRINLSAKTK